MLCTPKRDPPSPFEIKKERELGLSKHGYWKPKSKLSILCERKRVKKDRDKNQLIQNVVLKESSRKSGIPYMRQIISVKEPQLFISKG